MISLSHAHTHIHTHCCAAFSVTGAARAFFFHCSFQTRLFPLTSPCESPPLSHLFCLFSTPPQFVAHLLSLSLLPLFNLLLSPLDPLTASFLSSRARSPPPSHHHHTLHHSTLQRCFLFSRGNTYYSNSCSAPPNPFAHSASFCDA